MSIGLSWHVPEYDGYHKMRKYFGDILNPQNSKLKRSCDFDLIISIAHLLLIDYIEENQLSHMHHKVNDLCYLDEVCLFLLEQDVAIFLLNEMLGHYSAINILVFGCLHV